MHPARFRASWAALLLVLAVVGPASTSAQEDFQVVVNSGNPTATLTAKQVSNLFLKKTTAWPDGLEARPVDLQPLSTTRARFSTAVHGRPVEAVKRYWQRQIFAGRGTPPVELTSDREVLEFVSEHPGAIGYVAAQTALSEGVSVLSLREE